METAIVIRGVVSEKQFIPNEPMPDVEGPAKLIIYLQDATKPILPNGFVLFGRSAGRQTAEK